MAKLVTPCWMTPDGKVFEREVDAHSHVMIWEAMRSSRGCWKDVTGWTQHKSGNALLISDLPNNNTMIVVLESVNQAKSWVNLPQSVATKSTIYELTTPITLDRVVPPVYEWSDGKDT